MQQCENKIKCSTTNCAKLPSVVLNEALYRKIVTILLIIIENSCKDYQGLKCINGISHNQDISLKTNSQSELFILGASSQENLYFELVLNDSIQTIRFIVIKLSH